MLFFVFLKLNNVACLGCYSSWVGHFDNSVAAAARERYSLEVAEIGGLCIVFLKEQNC